MKKVPSTVVKNRSRELTLVFESFSPYQGMAGQTVRIWITEIATDGVHLVCQLCNFVNIDHNYLPFVLMILSIKVSHQTRICVATSHKLIFYLYNRLVILRNISKSL